MPTYAKGTLTEFCDIQGDLIAVGDRLRAEDGSYWRINKYLQAVPEGEGMCINKLAAFIREKQPVIATNEEKPSTPPTPTEKPSAEMPIKGEKRSNFTPISTELRKCTKCGRELLKSEFYANSNTCKECKKERAKKLRAEAREKKEGLGGFTDAELAEQLRARGFDVTAVKRITIEL